MTSAVYRSDGTLAGHVGFTSTGNGAVTSASGGRSAWVGYFLGGVSEGDEANTGRVLGNVSGNGTIIRGGSSDGYDWSGGDVVGHVSASGQVTDARGATVGNVSPPLPEQTGVSGTPLTSHIRIMGGAALFLLL